MREALMSRGLFVAATAEPECARARDARSKPAAGWNPQDFAREQIRSLVRQIFLSSERSARQVVFSAIEPETDVLSLCRRVGESLALETKQGVVVVGDYPQALHDSEMTEMPPRLASESALPNATRVASNLWLLPPSTDGTIVTHASLHSYLGAVRSGFEYSIVAGPPAAESIATIAMAQLADGIVLVVSAKRTRRMTARKIKEKLELAQARVLGIVLSDRAFPIPERIYRRL